MKLMTFSIFRNIGSNRSSGFGFEAVAVLISVERRNVRSPAHDNTDANFNESLAFQPSFRPQMSLAAPTLTLETPPRVSRPPSNIPGENYCGVLNESERNLGFTFSVFPLSLEPFRKRDKIPLDSLEHSVPPSPVFQQETPAKSSLSSSRSVSVRSKRHGLLI